MLVGSNQLSYTGRWQNRPASQMRGSYNDNLLSRGKNRRYWFMQVPRVISYSSLQCSVYHEHQFGTLQLDNTHLVCSLIQYIRYEPFDFHYDVCRRVLSMRRWALVDSCLQSMVAKQLVLKENPVSVAILSLKVTAAFYDEKRLTWRNYFMTMNHNQFLFWEWSALQFTRERHYYLEFWKQRL